jgi:hypothetical protein
MHNLYKQDINGVLMLAINGPDINTKRYCRPPLQDLCTTFKRKHPSTPMTGYHYVAQRPSSCGSHCPKTCHTPTLACFFFLWLYKRVWTLASLMILSQIFLSGAFFHHVSTFNNFTSLRHYQATLIWVFPFSESLQAARRLSFCKVSFPPFWLNVLAILSWLLVLLC